MVYHALESFAFYFTLIWCAPAMLYVIYWFIVFRTRQEVDPGKRLEREKSRLLGSDSEGSGSEDGAMSTDIDTGTSELSLSEGEDGLSDSSASEAGSEAERDPDNLNIKVLYASLEHKVPHMPKAGGNAGGLGKVTSLVAEHHPTDIVMVHPMLKQDESVSYAGITREDAPLEVTMDNRKESIRVFRHSTTAMGLGRRVEVDILLLSHPRFEVRAKNAIYPNPMTRREVLRFFALWNAAVAELLVRAQPHVFHCPDFHTAIAPWMALPRHPSLRVLLVLHNAEYQGSISTNMMHEREVGQIAQIFNVEESFVREHMTHEGRFNMLKSAVDFVLKQQSGHGVCAVSRYYAKECFNGYSLFWRLPKINGLDNPMLESERPRVVGPLALCKADAKRQVQEDLGLNVDPNARMFMCVGRLVRQKGVDILADIAPWLLKKFPNVQLVVIGPVGDGFGGYAARKLDEVLNDPANKGRVFIKCEFWKVPPSLRFAADYCIMPSRDEPFGYVDIEFAWHGAVMVGAQAGGLGKVPGFYYIAQNRENLDRLRRELKRSVEEAMGASPRKLSRMQKQALMSRFPLDVWHRKLLRLYGQIVPPEMREEAHPGAVRSSTGRSGVDEDPEHLDMLDVTTAVQHFFTGKDIEDEFLQQELSEEQLAQRVGDKIAEFPNYDISTILSAVGHDVDMERETHPVARWLLGTTFGVIRVHWCVTVGYVTSPICSLLAMVLASEWTVRNGAGYLLGDATYLGMLLFSFDAFGFLSGVLVWTFLCQVVQPRRVMAANLLLKVPIGFCLLYPYLPAIHTALTLIWMNGFLASGSLIFMVFNFMMSIQADLTHVAIRLGILESVRYSIVQLAVAYVLYKGISDLGGTAEKPWPLAAVLVLTPMAAVFMVVTIGSGVLMLFAPGPYRDDRFPGWDLGLLLRKKSFLILSLSDVIGALGSYAAMTYITWWIYNGWSTIEAADFMMILWGVLVVGTTLWALSLSWASKHGFSFLLGVVLLLGPPAILRAIAQKEAATYTRDNEKAVAVVVIGFISILIEGVRASAISTAKICILGSRWRFLSYSAVVLVFIQAATALSPILSQDYWAKWFGGDFIEMHEKPLADGVFSVLCVVFPLQFMTQMAAAIFIRRDLGMSFEREMPDWRRFLRRAFPLFVLMIAGGLALAVFVIQSSVGEVFPSLLFRRCKSINTDIDLQQCNVTKTLSDLDRFGPNKYGLDTSGKSRCVREATELKGDTIRFWGTTGLCEVLSCGKEPVAIAAEERTSNETVPGEVWSMFCDYWGGNPVIVHLFEWTWPDVAQECEQFLGPAGFDAVQVSPVVEHVIGDSWTIRYAPVSYKLDSRSGTPEEFADMVSRCRKAGVHVMVDVILNHMAGLYIQMDKWRTEGHAGRCNPRPPPPTNKPPWPETIPCEGWAGTPYGDRQFLFGTPGLDLFHKTDFHHYPGNPSSNCGWGGPLCDMVALPDLDTERPKVQGMLGELLEMLNDLGVTYLRLDAGAWIYPDSVQRILQGTAWEYIVQEYYGVGASVQYFDEAIEYSHMTDFGYGVHIGLDTFDSLVDGKWVDGAPNFKKLLHQGFGQEYTLSYGLMFVDNHDQQRERWKPEHHGPPKHAVCEWDVAAGGEECRPMFKHGLQYIGLAKFMLAWPLSADSVRLMSSYSFETFYQGPPGVGNNTEHAATQHVYGGADGETMLGCRPMPTTSPVTDSWDSDSERPWICEHRWEGVAAFVRLRKLLGGYLNMTLTGSWSDDSGHIAFAVNNEAFFVLSRGWNWFTDCGTNETVSVPKLMQDSVDGWSQDADGVNQSVVEEGALVSTSLPGGTYCDLGRHSGPLGEDGITAVECPANKWVTINSDGTISGAASVAPWGAMALHVNYRVAA